MVARRAAIFPFRLCRAILEGCRKQLIWHGIMGEDSVGLHDVDEDESPLMQINGDSQRDTESGEIHSIGSSTNTKGKFEREYRDDLSGQPLRPDLVRRAIKVELDYFNEKGCLVNCAVTGV